MLEDFLLQHNLLAGSTDFQKPSQRLWTWRHLAGHLSQIDFILYRKRWRNSIHDYQAHTSSASIGGDQKIVTATVKLSLRTQKKPNTNTLNVKALKEGDKLANIVYDLISEKLNPSPRLKDHARLLCPYAMMLRRSIYL